MVHKYNFTGGQVEWEDRQLGEPDDHTVCGGSSHSSGWRGALATLEVRTASMLAAHLSKPVLFKASALWADAFYKSVCTSVCSLLRYRLTVFLPPLPEVGCPIFLEIKNPWGKSNGKKWSHI